MALTNSAIHHNGKKLVIRGNSVRLNEKAPDARVCELTEAGIADLTISSFRGGTLLLSVVPSVDTSTCHAQTKALEGALQEFKGSITALTVSVDLPFAQARWKKSEGCSAMRMVSDYKYGEFGERFGVYIESLGLLTRAVFLIDTAGVVRYIDYVENLSAEPEYGPILEGMRVLKAARRNASILEEYLVKPYVQTRACA